MELKEKNIKRLEWAASIIATVGIAIAYYFFFWGNLYACEQSQVFLWNGEYFMRYLENPSGVAAYLSSFIFQFFHIRWLGAVIIALLFLMGQRLVWKAACRLRVNRAYYLLSFFFIYIVFKETSQLGNVPNITIGSIINLALFILVTGLKSKNARRMAFAFATMLVCVLALKSSFVLIGLYAVYELMDFFRARRYYDAFVCFVCMSLIYVGIPCVIAGLTTWTFVNMVVTFFSDVSFVWMLVMLTAFLPTIGLKAVVSNSVSLILLFMYLTFAYVTYDWDFERYLRDDYDSLHNRWESIIERGRKHKAVFIPRNIMYNLALAKAGKMPDEQFIATPGNYMLFVPPKTLKERVSYSVCLANTLAFYHLGVINLGIEYAVEFNATQEGEKLNGRMMQLLTKLNIAKGNFRTAAKYINIYKKTLFHRDWAEEMESYLNNEAKIATNPELAHLRNMKYDINMLYASTDVDVMLYTLFMTNRKDRMLYEYLLSETMRSRDLKDFAICYELGVNDIEYARGIPRNYQQALALFWVMSGNQMSSIPWNVDNDIYEDCAKIYEMDRRGRDVRGYVRNHYHNTFWEYYFNE